MRNQTAMFNPKLMRIPPLLFLFAILAAGCSTTPQENKVYMAKPDTGILAEIDRLSLVGLWYGNQPTLDGGRKEWLTRRGFDGSFEVTFREWKDGKIMNVSTEVGEWGLSYNMEIVITRGWKEDGHIKLAPTESYYWDVYRIEKVDKTHVDYTHIGTDEKYTVKRVPDDFVFKPDN